MDATLLLCDAAQAVNGKFYILGGGWSMILAPGVPTPVTLAVKLSVPWDQANRPHKVRAALMDADGQVVDLGDGPIEAEGNVEVGRPPGLKPGTPLDVLFALPFGALAFESGTYAWQLEVDGDPVTREPFIVLPGN
ncbi:MAG: hypothetical protein M3P12_00620 [Gemmatimonadota bacterium]|nr:hypothetical protein [Gemmatimonadota bacterium]